MNSNWAPEYAIASERYNDLRREADEERLARAAAQGRPSFLAKAVVWLAKIVENMPCAQPAAEEAYCTVPVAV